MQNKDSNLSLEEFKRLVSKSPLRSKYTERQLLHLYSELTSHDGILTKQDWLSLFHHVEVRIHRRTYDRRIFHFTHISLWKKVANGFVERVLNIFVAVSL